MAGDPLLWSHEGGHAYLPPCNEDLEAVELPRIASENEAISEICRIAKYGRQVDVRAIRMADLDDFAGFESGGVG